MSFYYFNKCTSVLMINQFIINQSTSLLITYLFYFIILLYTFSVPVFIESLSGGVSGSLKVEYSCPKTKYYLEGRKGAETNWMHSLSITVDANLWQTVGDPNDDELTANLCAWCIPYRRTAALMSCEHSGRATKVWTSLTAYNLCR